MKKLLFLATGLITLASCSENDFVGDEALYENNNKALITFTSGVSAVTRADKTGNAAATDLGNRFIVWGEKNEGDGKSATANTNLVFPNYQVNYSSNTAYTTTSNIKDWEYVGMGHSTNHRNNIKTKAGDAAAVVAQSAVQTIKYWDYGASNYVFTAISADSTDINSNYVTITKNTMNATDGKFKKGYTITLTADAKPDKIFISDRCEITEKDNTNRTANKYGGNVTLKFRNLLSHIRVGMYETIPGYTVTISKFYYKDAANPAFTDMTTPGTDKFYANVPSVATTSGATLTVTYQSTGTTKNQPTIGISNATASNYIALGGEDAEKTSLKAAATLGETASTATFNESTGAYTSVYPQEANSTNLKLKLDYTLTSPTGETIEVKGATAEIPKEYLQWKPNYKYTYLFKISDNTNGQTGTGDTPAGLYPITFDAVEVVADDGKAEYITTVSEPSITTFGAIYNTNDNKYTEYQTDKEEYQVPSGNTRLDIYVTFMEGSNVKTPVLSGTDPAINVKIYKVDYKNGATEAEKEAFPITEASVAETLAETASGTKMITATDATTDASTYFTAAPVKVDYVPGEDGVDKTIDALKLTGVKAGIYAIEYEASSAWTGTYKKVYKIIKVAAATPAP